MVLSKSPNNKFDHAAYVYQMIRIKQETTFLKYTFWDYHYSIGGPCLFQPIIKTNVNSIEIFKFVYRSRNKKKKKSKTIKHLL